MWSCQDPGRGRSRLGGWVANFLEKDFTVFYWRHGPATFVLLGGLAFVHAVGCSYVQEAGAPIPKAPVASKTFSVHIRTPEGPPKVKTAQVDFQGKPVFLRCATCHALNEPNRATHAGVALKTFHQGLTYQHGNLTCISCHHEQDYDSLRGADNRKIPFTKVLELCSQCHGPQARDYNHGAHGGMSGHWDLTRGPRTRNNCIDCHDPHHPAYPKVQPVFPPKDRFPPAVHPGGHP